MLESSRAVLGMAARTCVAYGRASTPAPTVVPADACRPPVSSSWARQQIAHVCCIQPAPRALVDGSRPKKQPLQHTCDKGDGSRHRPGLVLVAGTQVREQPAR